MTPKGSTRRTSQGFTIMEVMMAVLILAVSVTSIFGAQFAAVATVEYSRYSTHAIQLARCRMSEIELEIQTENGFEESDVVSSGDCCEMLEGELDVDFSCNWEIKTIDLPDITTLMSGADGGMGMLGDLTGGMGGDMGTGSVQDSMDDFGMMGMISSFAPMLSEMLHQAIRRVTVTVEWEQGMRSKKREFVLSQYLTHPTQGPLQLLTAAADANDRAEMAEDAVSDTTQQPSRGGRR